MLRTASVLISRARYKAHYAVAYALPFVLLVGLYAGVFLLLAPSGDSGRVHHDYDPLLTTAAGVLVGPIIALAFEFRGATLTGLLLARPAAVLALVYPIAAEVAAVSALSPGVSAELYRHLFTLTVSGGLAGFAAVLLIGIQTATRAVDTAELQGLAALGDPVAEELLKVRAESADA
jgi:hypothetical protein